MPFLHLAPLHTLQNFLKKYHLNTLYFIAHLHVVFINLHAILVSGIQGPVHSGQPFRSHHQHVPPNGTSVQHPHPRGKKLQQLGMET